MFLIYILPFNFFNSVHLQLDSFFPLSFMIFQSFFITLMANFYLPTYLPTCSSMLLALLETKLETHIIDSLLQPFLANLPARHSQYSHWDSHCETSGNVIVVLGLIDS